MTLRARWLENTARLLGLRRPAGTTRTRTTRFRPSLEGIEDRASPGDVLSTLLGAGGLWFASHAADDLLAPDAVPAATWTMPPDETPDPSRPLGGRPLLSDTSAASNSSGGAASYTVSSGVAGGRALSLEDDFGIRSDPSPTLDLGATLIAPIGPQPVAAPGRAADGGPPTSSGGAGAAMPGGQLVAPGPDTPPAAPGAAGRSAPATAATPEGAVAEVAAAVEAQREQTVYVTPHDTTLTVAADRGVLAGVTTTLGGPLTADLITPPASGTLDLAADGSFTFTPDYHFVGAVSFDFEVFDDGTSVGVFTQPIYVENRAPFAYGAEFAIHHDPQMTWQPGLSGQLSGQDDNGDALTFTVTQGVSAGTLEVDPGGSFTYDPPIGFAGDVTFKYKVSDGMADSQPETVTIKVTDEKPEAAADAYAVAHDRELVVYGIDDGLIGNDHDADDDVIMFATAHVVTQPANGSVVVSPDGGFTYTPDPGFVGEDSFYYAINDGALDSDPAPVAVTVFNHEPIAGSHTVYTSEGMPVYGSVGTFDFDGDELTATLLSAPAAGDFTLSPDGSWSYTSAGVGSTYFTYELSDGLSTSNVGMVYFSEPVGNAPQAPGAAYSTLHKNPLELVVAPLAGFTNGPEATWPPPWVVVDTPPALGILTPDPYESFTYSPFGGVVGFDSFVYHGENGYEVGSSGTVHLGLVNDNPIARADSFPVFQFGTVTGNVYANDWETLFAHNYETVTSHLVTGPAVGTLNLLPNGNFTYTPPIDFSGLVSFTYKLFDEVRFSNVATVRIPVFRARVVGAINIANGLEDGGVPGDNPVKPEEKRTKGAATVANRNDTDNDGTQDSGDNDISVAAPNPNQGRQERDMMLVTLHKPVAIGNPLPAGTKFRAAVTAGPAVLWQFHQDAGGGIDQRQSKKSGAFPASFTLADFPEPTTQMVLYAEATDPTALRGITIEYQYQLPGKAWETLDSVKATAVWVNKVAVWKDRVGGAGAAIPPGVVRDSVVDSIKEDKAADGSYFGHGEFSRARPAGAQARFGGRILYEHVISPIGSEALVLFDNTRQAKAMIRYLPAGLGAGKWVDIVPAGGDTMPKAEAVNDDPHSNDQQNDPRVKNAAGTKQANGELYDFDTPSVSTDGLKTLKAGFLAFRANFNAFVRVLVKGPGIRFKHALDAGSPAPPTPNVQGSRASDIHPWHQAHHLVWDGTKYAKDNTNVTASGAFFKGTGVGTMTVTTGPSAVTEGIKAVYDKPTTKWTVTLDSGGAPGIINGATGTVDFLDGGGNLKYRVEITQAGGAVAFETADEFKASVYKTTRTTKENELAEGHLTQDPAIN